MSKRRDHSSSPDERDLKQLKLEEYNILEDDSKEVPWCDIEQVITGAIDTKDEQPGWISATIIVIFGFSKEKTKVEFQLSNGLSMLKATVFSKSIYYRLRPLQFIRLSLRGANLTFKMSKGGTSAPNHLPFSIEFKEGVEIKFISGRSAVEDGEIIDTRLENALPQGDWFLTPPKSENVQEHDEDDPDARLYAERSEAQEETAPSSSIPPPVTLNEKEQGDPTSSINVSDVDPGTGESNQCATSPSHVRETRKRKNSEELTSNQETTSSQETNLNQEPSSSEQKSRRVKKRETRRDYSCQVAETQEVNAHKSDQPVKLSKRSKRQKIRATERVAKEANEAEARRPPDPPGEDPLNMEAGLVSAISGTYLPLKTLLETKRELRTHIIAVARMSEKPVQIRGADFKTTLILTDPSIGTTAYGFKVMCFMKSGFQYLLPSPEEGKIILLRDVRVTPWGGGTNGVVYDDKLKWVQFDPVTEKYEFPPTIVNLGERTLSTLYRGNRDELRYIIRLTRWYRAIESQMIQIATTSKRPCQLMGTIEVDVFFDAIVEIVELIKDGAWGQTQLYLTDYTSNNRISPSNTYGRWVIYSSSNKIPADNLDLMTEESIWRMENIRIKYGRSGFLELDLFRARYRLLDVADADHNAELREFLRRKNDYLSANPELKSLKQRCQRPDVDSFSHISELTKDGYHNIIAELVYKCSPTEKITDIFVTDYTENPILSTFIPEPLKKQLKGKLVPLLHIGCWDERDNLRDMKPGDIVKLTEVRIHNSQDNQYQGRLKLTDQHSTRLSANSTEPMVHELLRRKKEYDIKFAEQPSPELVDTLALENKTLLVSNVVKSRHTNQPLSTVKRILATKKCPNKFRLIARIVDFYPKDVRDFTLQFCKNCNQEISRKLFACASCSDMLREHCQWRFRFFFLLEDESGDRIMADICSEADLFLSGIRPCDFHEETNNEALSTLKNRLAPCIGNIIHAHGHLKDGPSFKAQYGPFLDLAVKCWEVEGQKLYSLTGCELVDFNPS